MKAIARGEIVRVTGYTLVNQPRRASFYAFYEKSGDVSCVNSFAQQSVVLFLSTTFFFSFLRDSYIVSRDRSCSIYFIKLWFLK